MEGHAQKCVARFCELPHKTSDQHHKVSTPFLDEHQMKPEDLGIMRELSETCSISTSHQLHSSHNKLQTELSHWKSSNRLQAWIIPRRQFCRIFLQTPSQPQVVLCADLDHIHVGQHHGLARNSQLYPTAALKLRFYRLMQDYEWMAVQQ